ncbi:TrmO family methyltransferase [Micromonospora sp. NPDC005174]|uniref:TrmO family methyltransferase domain-containing protein n=1 Tax=Micromonospora sp. NPDC005174 TaxID=3157018 RepID=UPI0033B308A4
MVDDAYLLRPVGRVASPLVDGASTPRQGGVFSTRSPHRPNPIGLHRVRVLAVDGLRVEVADLEALDGTPVLDVKPVLGAADER